jgi:hypothetical protein
MFKTEMERNFSSRVRNRDIQVQKNKEKNDGLLPLGSNESQNMVEKHLKGLKGCFIKKNISQSRIL